jgi:hypothetical protein
MRVDGNLRRSQKLPILGNCGLAMRAKTHACAMTGALAEGMI